jgi:hypothetical protein
VPNVIMDARLEPAHDAGGGRSQIDFNQQIATMPWCRDLPFRRGVVMKKLLTVGLVIVFAAHAAAALAQADTGKKPEKKPVPDIDKSPWSATITNHDNGFTGTSKMTIKRDMGQGWSVGGQMVTPYEDQRIGGSGAPGLRDDLDGPKRGTMFGPVFEKQF